MFTKLRENLMDFNNISFDVQKLIQNLKTTTIKPLKSKRMEVHTVAEKTTVDYLKGDRCLILTRV